MLPASNPSRRVLERIASALTGERAPRAPAPLDVAVLA